MIAIENIEQEMSRVAANVADFDWNPVLGGDVRKEALQAVRDNFTSSATPEGRSWPPRKHRGDGHPLLIDTGRMLQAATGGGPGHVTRVQNDELTVGVDDQKVPYAKYHNEGTRRMPRREFMGAGPKKIKQIGEILADAGLEAFE